MTALDQQPDNALGMPGSDVDPSTISTKQLAAQFYQNDFKLREEESLQKQADPEARALLNSRSSNNNTTPEVFSPLTSGIAFSGATTLDSSTPSTSPVVPNVNSNGVSAKQQLQETMPPMTTTATTATIPTVSSIPSSFLSAMPITNDNASPPTSESQNGDISPSLQKDQHSTDILEKPVDATTADDTRNLKQNSTKHKHRFHRGNYHRQNRNGEGTSIGSAGPESPESMDPSAPLSAAPDGIDISPDSAPDGESATTTPQQQPTKGDKGKGKRMPQFFNTAIFKTGSSRPTAGIVNAADDTTSLDPTTSNLVPPLPAPVTGTNGFSDSPGSSKRASHHHLHKTRSKSDVGLYGDTDTVPVKHRRRRGSHHSDNHDARRSRDDDEEGVTHMHESHSDTELDNIKDEQAGAAAGPSNRPGAKRRLSFLPRYSTFSANGSSHHVITANNSHMHNDGNPEAADGADIDNLADPHQRASRRHALFSMDYNPPSIAIDWKDVKHALRRFKKKRHERTESTVHEDGNAVVAELAAGTPGAMIIPMSFLKDDRGIPRIPVLLHHVKASVIDITSKTTEKNRKYSIELSYGSGSTSLTWSIVREYRDLVALHSRLKVISFQNVFSAKLKLPKFPSRHHILEHMVRERAQQQHSERAARHTRTGSVITPTNSTHAAHYAPGSAPIVSSSHSSIIDSPGPNSAPAATSGAHARPVTARTHLSTIVDDTEVSAEISAAACAAAKANPVSGAAAPDCNTDPLRRSFNSERSASIMTLGSDVSEHSFNLFRRIRRTGSVASNLHSTRRPSFIGGHGGNIHEQEADRQMFFERLRQAVEKYLLDLFREMRFRPEANRLFQFLELSNMSIRLAPENSYHGKEGYLILRSSAGSMGWRVSHWKPNELSLMVDRHTSRWYLVRESYIVCVKDISSANVSEVFLVDSEFKVTTGGNSTSSAPAAADDDDQEQPARQGFTFQVENGERKMKLLTTSQRQLGLWIDSINLMKEGTIWSQPHRFGSFAPVRQNVQARWFVDARDYFWTVSVALDMAKDVIYIHDWWLSPELYLRRPPDGNQDWRLDRVLKRKAEEGVKIFVIVYRNVGQTVPIDSSWTKHSLLDLHPNIYLMRSPNQLLQNTYFWAHHEKLCLIDHTIGFLGGIDLCFGRWDTPDHVLVDDSPTAFYDPDEHPQFNGPTQIWPGKDYSNPRQRDFYSLDKPYDDMYNRNEVPRMPWHDVHMMVTGQSARDVSRHFVQRWNYLIRQKRPSRYTPILLPPADLTQLQLQTLNLEGSCEVQILRSSCFWSLGLKKPEHSIQNAYLKAIESSEHFVYIENQFFISSTFYEGTEIQNRIGDALVERIIRAHRNNEDWKCVVVIPLMPGFESEIDEKNGLSVRMIMQFQYLTISHGPNSIFGKLFKQNINPEDYIQFFSLRKWGKIGPKKQLVTEQLYLHCKVMVVDDRIAIIGSANVNERSMRGNRDSEVAAIIRDTDTIESVMAGKKYKVGRFPHTMRMRLMREHVGIDIDQLEMIEHLVDQELSAATLQQMAPQDPSLYDLANGVSMSSEAVDKIHGPVVGNDLSRQQKVELHSFNHLAGVENIGLRDKKPLSNDSRVQGNKNHRLDVEGLGLDKFRKREAREHMGVVMTTVAPTDADSMEGVVRKYFEQLLNDVGLDAMLENVQDIKRQLYYYLQTRSWRKDTGTFDDVSSAANGGNPIPIHFFPRACQSDDQVFQFRNTDVSGGLSGNGVDMNGNPSQPSLVHGPPGATLHTYNPSSHMNPSDSDAPPPQFFAPVDPYSFQDPVSPDFYYDMWERVADQNTLLFREVFHCQPDDEVTTWKEYIEFKELFKRFAENQGQNVPEDVFERNIPTAQRDEYEMEVKSALSVEQTAPPGLADGETPLRQAASRARVSLEEVEDEEERARLRAEEARLLEEEEERVRVDREKYEDMLRRRRQNRRSSRNVLTADDVFQPSIAQRVVQGVRGNLVFFPTQWLAHELESGNWQHAIDHLPPIEIYD